MHSCFGIETRDAGWRRRQEEHPRWARGYPRPSEPTSGLRNSCSKGWADGDARTELFRLAVRKVVEETLETEVSDALGRGYYESGAEPGRGYRNGYQWGRRRTAEAAIEYGVPQVAGSHRSPSCRGSGRGWLGGPPNSSGWPSSCSPAA